MMMVTSKQLLQSRLNCVIGFGVSLAAVPAIEAGAALVEQRKRLGRPEFFSLLGRHLRRHSPSPSIQTFKS
jgi:hypothetical protein